MKESISPLDQLEQKRTKVNSALDKVGKLITTPSTIINNNLRLTIEEASRLPIQERVIPLKANVTKRKKIQQNLQEKTEPYLKSLGLRIDDEILELKTEEESALIIHQQLIESDLAAKKTDMPTPQIDVSEMFALASIWASNPNLAAEYGVEPLPKQVVLNLKPLMGEELISTKERQKEIAAAALEKILEVVNSDKLDQVYDSQPPPVQDLLLHFTTIDPESVANFLNKTLSKCDENVQPTTLPEPAVDKLTESPKIKEIERRDAQVRETVSGILSRIDAHRINKSVSTVQLVKFFPNLKAKFVTQIEEDKRYITPQRGRDGRHPVFNREEITFLLYVREHGNNLTPRLVKDLKEIIVEEIEQRSQNNGNKNGATKDQSGQQITIEQPQGPRVNGPKPASSIVKSRAEDENQTPELELSAINLFIKIPHITTSGVNAVLSQRETLTSDQIQSELAEVAAKLYEKITQGLASQAEIDVWERLKKSTKLAENKEALREFRSAVKAWFQRQNRVEDQTSSIITVEEEVVAEAEEAVTQPPEETASPVIEDDQITPGKEQPSPRVGWREKLFSRFKRRDEKEDHISDASKQGKENTKITLPVNHKDHPAQDYLERINEELLKRLPGDLKAIELDHPAVRADIYYYFDLMDEIRQWPLNSQRLTQIDPSLTWMSISPLMQKRLFSNNNFTGRPTFSKSDVALALFVVHHDIDLAQTHLEHLKQIIKEEEEYRNKLNKS